MTAEEVTKELEDTEALVQELTGQTTKPYFRPPFGSRSQLSIKTAYDLGYTTIIWTYGADEWRDGATAQTIYDNVYGNKAPGAAVGVGVSGAAHGRQGRVNRKTAPPAALSAATCAPASDWA